MRRPNILLIHSDQHRFDCVGVNGHPLLKTPNLDRLASEGVNFTHAFCPIPLCVPVRNSLLHGQWPTEHLCIANWDTKAPRLPGRRKDRYSIHSPNYFITTTLLTNRSLPGFNSTGYTPYFSYVPPVIYWKSSHFLYASSAL